MKKNKLNREESNIQKKLDQLEIPYNPKHWDEMENMLNSQAAGASGLGALKVASIFVVIGALAYFSLLDYTSSKKAEQTAPSMEKMEVKEAIPAVNRKKQFEKDQTANSHLVEAEEIKSEKDAEVEKLGDTILDFEEENFAYEIVEIDQEESADTVNAEIAGEAFSFEILDPGKICLYHSIHFRIKNGSNFDKVDWKANGKSFDGEYKFFEAGNYSISAQTSVNGTKLTDTIQLNLLPEAEFDFTYEQKEGLFNDFIVQFKPEANVDLNWLIQGNEIEEQEPLYNFRKEGLYDVTAYSINDNGCKTELYKPVAVMKDFHFYAPNAFSPNADGINDIFLPPLLEEMEYHYELMVYDLSGTEVFITSQKGVGWNGKMNNNGQKLPIGNYVWKVIIKNAEGQEKRFTGPIKIVEFD